MAGKSKVVWASALLVVLLAVGCSTPPALSESAWCNNVQPAGPGPATGDVLGQLSLAHARIRFFGVFSDPTVVDQALATAFSATPPPLAGEAPDAVSGNLSAVMTRYQGAMTSICVLPADTRTTLPAASVELKGTVAIIHPGTGSISLPGSTTGVAVDLRNLPNVDGLTAALNTAFSQAISGHITQPARSVRESVGLTDEAYGGSTPYSNVVEFFAGADFEGAAPRKWPVAVLTSARMPPYAALWAFNLRFNQKAWVYGEQVDAATAESAWSAVGTAGIAYRASELGQGQARWPDYVPADTDSKGLDGAVKSLGNAGTPADVSSSLPNSRTQLVAYSPSGLSYSTTFGPGEARAMLLVAHGTAELFFPFFATVGNTLDATLRSALGTLEAAGSPTRALVLQGLQQLAVALKDAGANAVDSTVTAAGVIPLSLDNVDAGVVVQRSAVTGINAGDIITAWNSQPMSDVRGGEVARTSASTDAYRSIKALANLTLVPAAVHLTLVSPGGAPHDLDVSPQAAATLTQAAWPSRASGFLTDHDGAHTVYYLNLDYTQTTTANFSNELKEAASAATTGVIVDLRGTVGVPIVELLPPFFLAQLVGPLEYVNVWEGPGLFTSSPLQNTIAPSSPAITTKVALLVSPATVGEAERFATTLWDVNRVTLVGRPTGGTVGDVSAVKGPGAFWFSFTGEDFKHVDGGEAQATPLTPDAEAGNLIEPLPTDYQTGIDAELERAITVVQTP